MGIIQGLMSRMVILVPLGMMEMVVTYKVKEMVAGKTSGPASNKLH